jgi:hypothetical protein
MVGQLLSTNVAAVGKSRKYLKIHIICLNLTYLVIN